MWDYDLGKSNDFIGESDKMSFVTLLIVKVIEKSLIKIRHTCSPILVTFFQLSV